jgi:hypothetical protein
VGSHVDTACSTAKSERGSNPSQGAYLGEGDAVGDGPGLALAVSAVAERQHLQHLLSGGVTRQPLSVRTEGMVVANDE